MDEARLSDPRALRAYAHPTRATLVGLLRSQGPLTATRAAELTGESVASCSYHLRMLAKYGLVEEAEGQGRNKPWRATARMTSWSERSDDPAVAAATRELNLAFAEHYFADMTRWIEHKDAEPPEWQDATQIGDVILYVTAAELEELIEELRQVMGPYVERVHDPSRRPDGARRIAYVFSAHPSRYEDR